MRNGNLEWAAFLRQYSGGSLKGLMALVAVSLILAACTSASPTPTPTARPSPTATPLSTATQAAPTPTPGLDLAAILRQHYDAINKDDGPGVLALLTDDAALVRAVCSSRAPCVGTAAIQLQLERDRVGQYRYIVVSIQVSGDTVTGRAELRNVNIKNIGLERVIENFNATFKGDKISQLAHQLDLSDSQSAAFANFRRVAIITTSYIDPLNLGNVARAMAALTEDAVFEGYGLCAAASCVGKAAIQKEVERLVADKTKITVISGSDRVTGDTQTSRREVRSDSIKATGVERILVAQTVEAKGDKASLIRWVPDTADAQTATYLKSQGR